jgi:16S rRNA G527 N7-methylase RsmG
MKRIGNIYQQITSLQNLQEADRKAQLGKSNQYGVLLHKRNTEGNLLVPKALSDSANEHLLNFKGFQWK